MYQASLIVTAGILLCTQAAFIDFNFGGRLNKLYVPTNYDPNSKPKGWPLFVILHGCTQDPVTIARGSKMNTIAEQLGFLVLYPLQPSTANMNKCWNWFEPAHQARGRGEPAFIAGATIEVGNQYTIDEHGTFCAGLSAGGAMSVMMGALYPDIFTSIGVMAGLEFKAATTLLGGLTAMREGGPNPTTQGRLAYNSMESNLRGPVQVFVVQGSADYTVYPINGDQSTQQWIATNNFVLGGGSDSKRIPTTPTQTIPGQVPGGRSYTEYLYSDSETGIVLVRYWKVTGMGHAWSGGDISGSYTDPKGPDASLIMAKWFLDFESYVESSFSHNN